MCRTCKKLPSLTTEQALDAIGKAVQAGKDPEHFKDALDRLLGTEVQAQDSEKDEAWEGSRDR